jgi:hypothetical protein
VPGPADLRRFGPSAQAGAVSKERMIEKPPAASARTERSVLAQR